LHPSFLKINKPKGKTSFSCLKHLRKILNIKKIGFLGTLDPLATGLLIFAIGEATKLIPFLEGLDKTYEVNIHFGAVSNTYDADGDIEKVSVANKPSTEQIEKVLKENFLGEQEQIPPAFSAIHVEGQRAYDLARKGEKVKLKSRSVVFHNLKLLDYEWPIARILVHCSSGTYVRSFAHDLGQKLGCGGYVEELKRTKIGKFSVEDAVPLDENVEQFLIPPEKIFTDWQSINLSEQDYKILANGGRVFTSNKWGDEPILGIYKDKCAGVIEVKNSKLKFKKKFNILQPCKT
jgi:tRNA pseudouridine55 synthase